MSEGVAPARTGAKWGFIKSDGAYVLSPAFDAAKPFQDGLAEVAIGKQMAYIDHKGRVVWKERE